MNLSFKDIHKRIWSIACEEMASWLKRPLLIFCLIAAPVISATFFTTLMWAGLPTELPVAVVDEDDTQTTRSFLNTVDAFQQTNLVAQCASFSEAREMMQRGEIYGIFYLPKGLTEDAIAQRQPAISFYTNDCYFIPAALIMKDLRTACELLGMSITRASLSGRGVADSQIMGVLQPIVIDKHPLGNPTLNYSVYLCNIILPGLLFILAMLTTSYVLGDVWKRRKQRRIFWQAGYAETTAIAGKVLPITFVYSVFIIVYDVYLYRYLGFPCHCNIASMMLWGILGVMASQGIAILVFGILIGQMRMAMSVCSLWGIMGISLSGFTFPVSAMHPVLQVFCNLFPLRHYYLIYVNQALNGYDIAYVWPHCLALLIFMIAPFAVAKRYHYGFLKAKYKA